MLVDMAQIRQIVRRFHIPSPGCQYATARDAASAIAVTLKIHHTTLLKYSRSESLIILLSISSRANWAVISMTKCTIKTLYAGSPSRKQR